MHFKRIYFSLSTNWDLMITNIAAFLIPLIKDKSFVILSNFEICSIFQWKNSKEERHISGASQSQNNDMITFY